MFKIEIGGTDNAAFEGSLELEIARILKKLAKRLEDNGMEEMVGLMDVNGNTVGYAEYEPDEMEEEGDAGEDE